MPAFDALEAIDDDEVLGVSVHVLCELRVGAELSRKPLREHDALDRLLSGLLIRYPDKRFVPTYARLLASIDGAGDRSPPWICSSAQPPSSTTPRSSRAT